MRTFPVAVPVLLAIAAPLAAPDPVRAGETKILIREDGMKVIKNEPSAARARRFVRADRAAAEAHAAALLAEGHSVLMQPYLRQVDEAGETALIFFDHLRIYNQILFLYASSTMGGFESDTIPDHINVRDSVFFPVLETLGITLIALIPVITMRVFAEERARGTDELLLTLQLSPGQIVLAKFVVTWAFVVLMMAGSFVYPAMATVEGGIGAEHLLAVFVGLSLHALGLASLGLACSAFSSSQLVAAVASWAVGAIQA